MTPQPHNPLHGLTLEMMLRRMIGLLFIEVSAFHTFAWAEEILSDDSLVVDSERAARPGVGGVAHGDLVAFIGFGMTFACPRKNENAAMSSAVVMRHRCLTSRGVPRTV